VDADPADQSAATRPEHLLDVVNLLAERGVDLIALDQPIDTVSPAGKMLFTIMAAIAQFQADLISSNTIDGLAAARERHGGELPR
jgi:DNA invertase Pin-like site-specific DNA recombinase